MQSKKSFFNKYLYFKEIMRFWPLWTVVSICGCILSVIEVEGSFNSYRHTSEFSKYVFGNEAVNLFPWVTLFYAIAVAMCMWGYLYQKSSNFHFHALPVTRDELFITHFLAGLTITWIPFVIAAGTQIVALSVTSVINVPYLLFAIATALVEGLFFFSLATLTAFVTSNIVALPVLYIIFNLLEYLIFNMSKGLAEGFYPGYASSNRNPLEILSPLPWILTTMNYSSRSVYNNNAHYYELTESSIEGMYAVWVLLAEAMVLVMLALAAYRSKKNEDVGMVISIKWLRPVLLLILTYLSAVIFAEGVWLVLSDFSSYSYYSIPVISLLFIIGGGITFFVGLMILAKTTRVFNKKSCGVFALIAVFFIMLSLTLGNDWLHIARQVPKESQIESIILSAGGSGDEYILTSKDDGELVSRVLHLNKAINDEAAYIKATSNNIKDIQEAIHYFPLNISYNLANGKEIKKRYEIPMLLSRIDNPDTCDYKIDEFFNSTTMVLKRTTECKGRQPEVIYVTDYEEENGVELKGEEMYELIDVIASDVIENGACRENWFDDEKCYNAGIELRYGMSREIYAYNGEVYYDYDRYRWLNLNVDMTNTVNYMLEKGYITQRTVSHTAYNDKVDYVY